MITIDRELNDNEKVQIFNLCYSCLSLENVNYFSYIILGSLERLQENSSFFPKSAASTWKCLDDVFIEFNQDHSFSEGKRVPFQETISKLLKMTKDECATPLDQVQINKRRAIASMRDFFFYRKPVLVDPRSAKKPRCR